MENKYQISGEYFGFDVFEEVFKVINERASTNDDCLLYTSPSPRDRQKSRMPSSA